MLPYTDELPRLQAELVKLQAWVQDTGQRLLLIFEGRDTAGKGGAIRRFTRHLNPRGVRVVSLPKPTERERGQWYFQRYLKELPDPGEIVFFDRSWYNRAVVEPVMGFCTEAEYRLFLEQVPAVERMLHDDGIRLTKFWFSIDSEEQEQRLKVRATHPLKQWKLSTMDLQAQRKWHEFTEYKEAMFHHTHLSYSPWIIVRGNDKQRARLESIRYVLSTVAYEGRDEAPISLMPNPEILRPYDGGGGRPEPA